MWLKNIPSKIRIVAFDGIADDSFKVLIKMQSPSGTWTDWTKVFTYPDTVLLKHGLHTV